MVTKNDLEYLLGMVYELQSYHKDDAEEMLLIDLEQHIKAMIEEDM